MSHAPSTCVCAPNAPPMTRTPGDQARSPLSFEPMASRALVPCQNVRTMVCEHKERAKRRRPRASPEELLMEALLPAQPLAKVPRKFGVDCSNSI